MGHVLLKDNIVERTHISKLARFVCSLDLPFMSYITLSKWLNLLSCFSRLKKMWNTDDTFF